MNFTPLPLAGAYIIDIQPIEDNRGFFARSWTPEDMRQHGLETHIAQCSISYNTKKGTLRGMHFQNAPYEEVKIVRCTAGAIWDVMIDLRPDSPTYLKWEGVELTATNRRMVYIPRGFAHGFQTLEDHSEVNYQLSQSYQPQAASGVLWNDPAFNIPWPLPVTEISERDQAWELLSSQAVTGSRE